VHAPIYGPAHGPAGVYHGYYRPYYPYYPYHPYYPYYGYGYGCCGWPAFSVGFGWGYPYPVYGYPYGAYGGYGPADDTSSLRLEVTPKNTEVYVDSYRAGTVNDFDGFSQRLHVRPGEHELVLYLDGYRTVRQRLYLSRGADQKIQFTMVPLAPGEPQEPRPQEPPDAGANVGIDEQMPPGAPEPPRPGMRGGPPPSAGSPPPVIRTGPAPTGTFGAVAIRVQPSDAEVRIDGDRWASSGGDRLTVELPEGRHHVEIQKDGYEVYSNDVQINRGETLTLNVSLSHREGR
jgi:hypothetical protein